MRPIDRDLIRGGHYGQRSREPHRGRTHGRTDQYCTREESPCQLGAVHTWPIATDDGWHKMWAYGVRAEVTDARLKRRSSPHGDMARGRSGDNATNRQPVSCKGPDHPIRQDNSSDQSDRCLDYTYGRSGVGYAVETKTCTRDQIGIFPSGTFASRE
jgi:hypothetical protein